MNTNLSHAIGDYVPISGGTVTGNLTVNGTFTFAGAVAGGDQTWTNVGDMTFAAGSILASGSTNGNTLLLRANDTTFITFTTGATDVCTIASPTMSGAWLWDSDGGSFGPQTNPNGMGDAIVMETATRKLFLRSSNSLIIATGVGAETDVDFRAYDVDGAGYTQFAKLLAGNTPSFTLYNPTFSGTALASGTFTMPAFTAGGNINLVNNEVIGVSALRAYDSGNLNITTYVLGAAGAPRAGNIVFQTGNASDPQTLVTRATMTGNAATSVLTWASIYHVGLKYGLAGTATGAFTMDGATSGVVTVKVSDVAGTWTMTLPAAVAAAAGYQLADNDGAGTCAWTAAASLREYKNVIGPHSPQDALDKILHASVYDFHYKEGKGTGDRETLYTGIMADEAPWAMHFQGGIVNPVNTLGYMVLGFQAHEERIVELERELAELKGRT